MGRHIRRFAADEGNFLLKKQTLPVLRNVQKNTNFFSPGIIGARIVILEEEDVHNIIWPDSPHPFVSLLDQATNMTL